MERVLVLEGVTHRGAVRGAEAAEQCNLLYACTLLQARWQLLHSGFTFQLHCSTIPFNFNAITVSLNVAVNQLPEMHTVDEAVHLLCLGAQGTAAYCSCPTQPYCSTLESFSVVSMFAEFSHCIDILPYIVSFIGSFSKMHWFDICSWHAEGMQKPVRRGHCSQWYLKLQFYFLVQPAAPWTA